MHPIRLPNLCALLAFIWIAHFSVDLMIGIWPVYKSLIKIDLAMAGLVVALGAMIGEGSQMLFGFLSDRGYQKWIIVIGILLAASSTFLAYFTDYGILLGIYMLTCIGSGAFHPAAAGLMNSLLPARRGLLMTIFSSGGSLGLAFSQLIFNHVNINFQGQNYWLMVPALIVAIGMMFYRFPRPANGEAEKVKFRDVFSFFKRKDLRLLYIATVANQSVMWGTIFILPDVLKALGHGTWTCFGGGHMCLILGGTVMAIPSGYLADRYSARSVMLVLGSIAFASFYSLIFFGATSTELVLPVLFLLGATLSVFHPIAISLGGRLVPTQPSTVSAFLMGLVWCVSEVIGPGGVGLVSTLFVGDEYAPVKALAILGSFFLLNLGALLLLPKKKASLAVVD